MKNVKRFISVFEVELFLIAIFLIWLIGAYGFLVALEKPGSWKDWADALYLSLQLFVINSGGIDTKTTSLSFEFARWSAPLCLAFAAVRMVLALAKENLTRFWLRFTSDHIVFCGCGDQARTLVKQYLNLKNKTHYKIVVIDINNTAKNKVFEEEGVVFLKEDAMLPEVLRQAGVDRAHCVYILAGSDQTNLAIHKAFEQVVGSRQGGKGKQSCIINLYDVTLKSLINNRIMQPKHRIPGWEVRTINTWENSARVLLTGKYGPHLHCPDEQQPHVLILGYSWLAEQLIIRGARLGHYSGGRKLRITYVDENAEHMRDMLYAQYPVLDPDRADHLKWQAHESNLLPVIDTCFIAKSPENLTGKVYAEIVRPAPLTVAYICDSDDERAMRILVALMANHSNIGTDNKPKIVLCDVHGNENVADYINSENKCGEAAYFESLKEGLELAPNESVVGGIREDVAKEIHEFYQKKYGAVDWDVLSEGMRNSNRESADHLKIKLDYIKSKNQGDIPAELATFHDQLMRMEHDRWCAERLMSGWRYCKKPETKQEESEAKEKKLNWCICSFDNLSPADQNKDNDVVELAATVGIKHSII